MPPNSKEEEVLEDEPNAFQGAQDPSLSASAFKKVRKASIYNHDGSGSISETGSSSEDPASASEEEDEEEDELSASESDCSFQSAKMDEDEEDSSHRDAISDSDDTAIPDSSSVAIIEGSLESLESEGSQASTASQPFSTCSPERKTKKEGRDSDDTVIPASCSVATGIIESSPESIRSERIIEGSTESIKSGRTKASTASQQVSSLERKTKKDRRSSYKRRGSSRSSKDESQSTAPGRKHKYKRDHPPPLKDESEKAESPDERQLVPYKGPVSEEEELQIVSYDPLQPPAKRRSSVNTSSFQMKPLDPEEEERRRNEVSTAMEILEHMRRANLVMEFGPGVDFQDCVFCLREERQQQGNSNTKGKPPKKTQHQHPLHDFLPKRRHEKQCLICHSPVCKQHWDHGFLHQQNVILCQDCAPLFDLDNLVECMNLSSANSDTESQKTQQEQHMRRLLILYDRALLALRHSSQSFDDNARRQIENTNWHKEGLGISSHVTNIASGVTGIAATAVFMTPMGPWLLLTSLALGGVATAVGSGSFLIERTCKSTQRAEQTIALAGMVDSLLEATTILRQAKITGTLPRAGALEDDETEVDEEDEDDEDFQEIKRISQVHCDSDPLLFLEEDKDQRLMITILKAKKDREERPKNPVQFVAKQMKKIGKDRAEEKFQRRKKRQRRYTSDDQANNVQDGYEEPKGPLRRIAGGVRRGLHRAQDTTVHAVSVAKTATTLAAVGMQAGGGGLVRQVTKTAKAAVHSTPGFGGTKAESRSTDQGEEDKKNANEKQGEAKEKNTTKEKRESKSKKGPQRDPRTASVHARLGLGMFARSFFRAAAAAESEASQAEEEKEGTKAIVSQDHKRGTGVEFPGSSIPRFHIPYSDVLIRIFVSAPDMDDSGKRTVAEIHHGNLNLKLRASGRAMKAFTRTNFRMAKKGVKKRRKRLVASDQAEEGENATSAVDRVFIKNARFLVKASLTVLRETARYAGGAFSAAIVCVETMELKEKVERINDNGVRSVNTDKLDRLKHNLWENSTGFPDSATLEWELFANPQTDIAEVSHLQRSSFCNPEEKMDEGPGDISPHWSSCFEGERPNGTFGNSPIVHDDVSQTPARHVTKGNAESYPTF